MNVSRSLTGYCISAMLKVSQEKQQWDCADAVLCSSSREEKKCHVDGDPIDGRWRNIVQVDDYVATNVSPGWYVI